MSSIFWSQRVPTAGTILVLLLLLPSAALAIDPVNKSRGGVAIKGYDPVAYFEEGGGKPKKGSKKIQLRHGDVLYWFSSEPNRRLFEKNPDRYEPKYGGWCAYAMSMDKRVDPDPKSFLVSDGELYVFYKNLFNNNRAKWLKSAKELETKAEANWKKFTEKPVPQR